MAFVTTAFGGGFALAQLAWRGDVWRLIERERAPRLALVSALGTVLAFLLYYGGAARASAVETTLCIQVEPAYSLLLSWLALGHRPTRRRVLATSAIVAGIACAVGIERVSASTGVWLLLATPLAWQLSHLVVLRGLPDTPPHVLTGARYVWGALLLGVVWLASGGLRRLPDPALWPRLLPLLAVQGTLLSWMGTLLWYNAIARLDLARATAIVVPSIPVLSFAANFAVLGDRPGVRAWAGLAVTLAGVLAFVTARDGIRTPAAE